MTGLRSDKSKGSRSDKSTGSRSDKFTGSRSGQAPAKAIGAAVRQSRSSFYWAMRLLPEARRQAMFSVYAFCRAVDDIADSAEPGSARLTALARWRAEIGALFQGRPSTPLGRALAGPVARHGLREADFLAVIAGMEMDAQGDIVAPSLGMLDLYCDRVASAVGRLSVRIFGDGSARADEVAWHLGRALQLTNILRDVAEDAARGRLYLPRELLDKHGVPVGPPAEMRAHPGIPMVCRDLAVLALRHFDQARTAMADCDAAAMRPAVLMAAVYRALLDRLIRSRWERLDQRVSVPKYHKLWLVLRHGLF